jgi:hypothetical protein
VATRSEDLLEIQRSCDRHKNRGALNLAFRTALLFMTIEVDGR